MSNVEHRIGERRENAQEWAQIASLIEEQLAFKARVAELLKRIEFSAWDGCGAEDECPECHAYSRTHSPDCALFALMKEAEA